MQARRGIGSNLDAKVPEGKSRVVLHESVRGNASWESVAADVLESSEDWIVSQIARSESPVLSLSLGFKDRANLLLGHDLHLYAGAMADRVKTLCDVQFSSIRVAKQHGKASTLALGEAWRKLTTHDPEALVAKLITRRSYATPGFIEEVADATQTFGKTIVPDVPLRLQVSYVTGLPRTWCRLWSPTVAAVFSSDSSARGVNSSQIVELGFDHRSIGEKLGHRVQMSIAASRGSAR